MNKKLKFEPITYAKQIAHDKTHIPYVIVVQDELQLHSK